jgi:predicted nucleic acid-binding protein
MAKIYFDTGALVKLYIVESGSHFVQKKAQEAKAIPLNPLQDTELRNAILAAGGRQTIDQGAVRQTLANLDEDIRQGFFCSETPDWPWIWQRANLLARQYTPTLLCRTLDILHVAAAEFSAVDEVVTGDLRQYRLCQAVDLAVTAIPPGD